jgi:hypothetical protein
MPAPLALLPAPEVVADPVVPVVVPLVVPLVVPDIELLMFAWVSMNSLPLLELADTPAGDVDVLPVVPVVPLEEAGCRHPVTVIV